MITCICYRCYQCMRYQCINAYVTNESMLSMISCIRYQCINVIMDMLSRICYQCYRVYVYENTGKVSTRLNGRQYFRWMSILECINYLVQFFTGRCQNYFFSAKLAFSCVHKLRNLVPCLSVQVLENSYLCVPQFPLCLTSFSLSYINLITY